MMFVDCPKCTGLYMLTEALGIFFYENSVVEYFIFLLKIKNRKVINEKKNVDTSSV